jgi:hypothetical protein
MPRKRTSKLYSFGLAVFIVIVFFGCAKKENPADLIL